jgi:hypothetical protein
MKHKLLSRDDFRNGVFARDGHRCVFCHRRAEDTPEGKLDAHHLIERRLFTEPEENGGYIIDNGITVCEDDHMRCETTEITVEDARERAGITRKVVPSYFYAEDPIDKWGNLIMPNGQRTKGPLFSDPSVQKVLARGDKLSLFTAYVKYGRTLHLPWSESMNEDDRMVNDMSHWVGREVIVTEKMDGENTSIYQDYTHARSVDGRSHPSRNLLKAFAARWQHDIPDAWRVCGENLYARHSIAYDDLPHHFMGFSVWNEMNERLAWDETLEWFELFGVTPVPVLYRGIYDEKTIRALWDDSKRDSTEGYVMTVADRITYGEFRRFTAKFVRKNHIQTIKHWMHGQAIIPNGFEEKF